MTKKYRISAVFEDFVQLQVLKTRFVPCVNVVISIIMWIKLAQAFGKGAAYGIGILFLPVVFLPMLGFGDAQYIGPASN